MGKVTGFLEIARQDRTYKPASDRVRNFDEFVLPLDNPENQRQAARCMDCGIPYCHQGCPVNNQIPDWNDLVYHDDWTRALRNLHSTNNFPEITGRICPAPCEAACTLNITDEPVTIRTIECAIVDRGFREGEIVPVIAEEKTGKRIAIVGSGPAGMAAAQQLARVGHDVHVYEKDDKAGGLLRYGIPNFKLDKSILDRRVAQMEDEGVTFHYNKSVGTDISVEWLEQDFDAVLLTGGSEKPRDLPVPGRDLDGVHVAMEFLSQQNRRLGHEDISREPQLSAAGKHVVVIGGGDTGSDCIGTSIRQGALSVTQLEIMPQPPEKENKDLTWPDWPIKMRTSTSQEEGAERRFSVGTSSFEGQNGRVIAVNCSEVGPDFKPVAGTDFTLRADLVLLAMGFVHPVHEGMIRDWELELDERGNVKANTVDYETSRDNIFVAGDMRRGQSLVVWAIREGRQAARSVDEFLMGVSDLPR
jgi:glutamate synthase (NADPH/NADH) small chain